MTISARATISLRLTITTGRRCDDQRRSSQAAGVDVRFDHADDHHRRRPPPRPARRAATPASTTTASASSENATDGQTAAKAIDGVVDGYPGYYTAERATAGGGGGEVTAADLIGAGDVEPGGAARPTQHVRSGHRGHARVPRRLDGRGVGVAELNGTELEVPCISRATTSLRFTSLAQRDDSEHPTGRDRGVNDGRGNDCSGHHGGSDDHGGSDNDATAATNPRSSATVTASSQNSNDGQTAIKGRRRHHRRLPGPCRRRVSHRGQGAGAWVQLGWNHAASPSPFTALSVTTLWLTITTGSGTTRPPRAERPRAGAGRPYPLPANSSTGSALPVDPSAEDSASIPQLLAS